MSCDLSICEPWVQFLVLHIFSAHNHRMESMQTLLGLRTDSAQTVYVSKHNLNHDYAHSIQNSSDSVRTGLECVGESKDLGTVKFGPSTSAYSFHMNFFKVETVNTVGGSSVGWFLFLLWVRGIIGSRGFEAPAKFSEQDEHTSRDLVQPPRLTALFLMMVLKHHAFVWVGWFLNEI